VTACTRVAVHSHTCMCVSSQPPAVDETAARPASGGEGDVATMTTSEKVEKAKEIVTAQVQEAKSALDKVKSLFGQ